MTRHLPFLILLAVSYYLLSVVPSFAQEITPEVTFSLQLNPQANEWEKFISNLIPDTLKQINCSSLPLDACEGINPVKSSLKPQAGEEKKDNKESVKNAAGQYVIASGINTPSELSNASTNIILDFLGMIASAIGNIFKRGEEGAINYAGTVLPEDVIKNSFNKTATNMDRALPLVQCAELPAGLCGDDNKPNFANK